MSCHPWREALLDAVYGELEGDSRDAFEGHLESCSRCREELAELRATVEMIDRARPPRPRPGEIDAWSRLGPELDALDRAALEGRRLVPRRLVPRRLVPRRLVPRRLVPRRLVPRRLVPRRLVLSYPAAMAAVAVLLSAGLGLGTLLRPKVAAPVVRVETVDETATAGVDREFARYLERATPLLLAVANRKISGVGKASFDPWSERRLAEELAAQAARLSDRLDESGGRRQAALIRDLEIVFLQMANLPHREYRRGMEIVQATIEGRALLFQLSVEEMRRL